jgi:hypothetical protein
VLDAKGIWMDPDMNKYDLNHRVSHHSGAMSDAEWEEAYRAAWNSFYTPEHINTILRRTCACPIGRPGTTLSTILWFYLMILFEGVHPLEGGAIRLKYRRDRRSGMKIENPLLFYVKYWGGTALKLLNYARVYFRCKAMLDAALKAPDRWTYSDIAIAPPKADEFEAMALYHQTAGGEAALQRKYRDDEIRKRTTHDTPLMDRSGIILDRSDRLQPGAGMDFRLGQHRRLRRETLDKSAAVLNHLSRRVTSVTAFE